MLQLPAADLDIGLRLEHTAIQGLLDGWDAIPTGVLGGAIPKASVLASIAGAGLGIGGINIEQILGPPDLDMAGDGCLDAYSIGLSFEAVAAEIVGVTAPPLEPEPRPFDTCGAALDCGLDCVAMRGDVDWECLSECLGQATETATSAALAVFSCPLGACVNAGGAEAIVGCMEDRYPASTLACLGD